MPFKGARVSSVFLLEKSSIFSKTWVYSVDYGPRNGISRLSIWSLLRQPASQASKQGGKRPYQPRGYTQVYVYICQCYVISSESVLIRWLLTTGQHRVRESKQSVSNTDDTTSYEPRQYILRDTPLPATVRERNKSHFTISDHLASENNSDENRRMQPTPQRSRGDGSSRAYTKAPSYNDSYEKHGKHHKRMQSGLKTRLAEDEDALGAAL